MMKKRFIIMNDAELIGSFKSRSDAEEFILSEVETAAYERYIENVYFNGYTHKQYIRAQEAMKNVRESWFISPGGKWTKKMHQTLYGAILNDTDVEYNIVECPDYD